MNIPVVNADISHVVWDWNGTLFNDAWLCMDAMNTLLKDRGLPLLTLERYQRAFDFPVIRYYERLGFDFEHESFEKLGTLFIQQYEQRRLECDLHDGALCALQHARNAGVSQSVLSAYKKDTLDSLLTHFGIHAFFNDVVGHADHYATGKVEQGLAWMRASGGNPAETLLIGDTVHDHEVASAMGIHCVLIAGGNQDRERLLACGAPLFPSLRAFMETWPLDVTGP
jgi:phosphoglycolate phosphatase